MVLDNQKVVMITFHELVVKSENYPSYPLNNIPTLIKLV